MDNIDPNHAGRACQRRGRAADAPPAHRRRFRSPPLAATLASGLCRRSASGPFPFFSRELALGANWFVGLPVDTGRWLAPLVRTAPATVRVFHPEDVHMTVAFLGAVPQDAAERAWATLQGSRSSPIELSLGGLRPMGNPRRPSALSGNDCVAALIATLRAPACAAAGARPDDRPPLPHITVARPSRSASPAELRTAVEWAEAQRPVGAKVLLDRLALFTWAADRRERQFRVVAQQPLAGAG